MTSDTPDPSVPPQPQAATPAPEATPGSAAPQIPQLAQPQDQPQWAWARPAPQIRWVETAPLEYHHLLRGVARYRWWKPLLVLILGVIYYLTLSVAYGLLVMLPYFLLSGEPLSEAGVMSLAIPDTQKPVSLVMALGSVALMIPAALLAMLSVGLRPWGRLWSVALRIRWRWIGRTVLPALAALVVMNVLGIALELALAGGAGEESLAEAPALDMTAVAWSLIIVLLLVPIQATAEELVYRGMFMQVLGAWLGGVRGTGGFSAFLRGPWLPIVIPAIAFGFSHIYDFWGWAAVVAMALAAGWISWRTGGLEAAISLHVVNNIVAFGFMAVGFGGETAQTSDGGGPGSLLGTIVGLALYVWWVDRDFFRRDGRRTRIDHVETEAPIAPIATS